MALNQSVIIKQKIGALDFWSSELNQIKAFLKGVMGFYNFYNYNFICKVVPMSKCARIFRLLIQAKTCRFMVTFLSSLAIE